MSIATGPRRFKNWLRRQPDNRVIGVRGETKYNPISQFLQEKTGIDFGVTTKLIFVYGKWDLRGDLPEWATKLNERLRDGKEGAGIQARTVKKLIDEIINETKVAA